MAMNSSMMAPPKPSGGTGSTPISYEELDKIDSAFMDLLDAIDPASLDAMDQNLQDEIMTAQQILEAKKSENSPAMDSGGGPLGGAQVTIDDGDITKMEAALQAVREALSGDNSPEAVKLVQQVTEAEKIAETILGKGDIISGAPAMTMEMCMASGKTKEECQAMMQSQQGMMQGPMMGGSELYNLMAENIGAALDTIETKLGGAGQNQDLWNSLSATENVLKALGGAAYPWDQCMSDQMAQYGSEDTAKRVCGMIKAQYG